MSVAAIQRALARRADAKTKAWWEAYMRGAIPFRGVPMVGIREVVHAWNGTPTKELALELLRQTYSEDKVDGFTTLVLDVCASLIQSRERFAQTGAGWVLRELGAAEPERVAAFVEEHRALLTKDALSSMKRRTRGSAGHRVDRAAR